MSQNDKVLNHIHTHGSITALDAHRFGCFRLAARIHDLRQKGVQIASEDVTEGGKTFARYSIKEFKETLF